MPSGIISRQYSPPMLSKKHWKWLAAVLSKTFIGSNTLAKLVNEIFTKQLWTTNSLVSLILCSQCKSPTSFLAVTLTDKGDVSLLYHTKQVEPLHCWRILFVLSLCHSVMTFWHFWSQETSSLVMEREG